MNNFSILSDHLFYSLIEYAEDRRRKGHSEGKMSVCVCLYVPCILSDDYILV